MFEKVQSKLLIVRLSLNQNEKGIIQKGKHKNVTIPENEADLHAANALHHKSRKSMQILLQNKFQHTTL